MALRYAVALLALAGCAHEQPFAGRDYRADTTRTRGPDRQLTYNLGTDLTPAWRPGGEALWYMFDDLSRPVRDRCLGELPPGGGNLRNIQCATSLGSADSVDTYYEPAIGPNGRFLFLRESSSTVLVSPNTSALMLAPDSDLSRGVPVRTYPYTAPSGNIHGGIAYIRWLNEDRAIYLGQKVQYVAPCRGCEIDTLRTGLEVMLLDLSGGVPAIDVVPNSSETSSLAVGLDPDLIYFTRNGDSRVYRRSLATGSIEILHDFGPGSIARDVAVRGTTLYAVAGGLVSFFFDSTLGTVQQDHAGWLERVELTNGSQARIAIGNRWFRRPTISPADGRVVAEAYTYAITSCSPPIGCMDTTVARTADLWLIEAP